MKKKDLYKTLGVDKNASDEEIKKAWKKSAVENHTDKGGDVDKMTEIVHAYSILSDKIKKDKYDKTGDDTNVTFDMRFQEFIQMFFVKIIDQTENIESVDLMKKIKEVAEANLSGTKQHKFELITKKGKMEKVVSRLESKGDNRITHILNLNIQELNNQIGVTDEHLAFMKDVMEVLGSYHYKFEPPVNKGFSVNDRRGIWTDWPNNT